MIIKNINIENLRGIKSLRIEDFGQVNLFLGHNNCGKTTILESIFLLTGASNSELIVKINNFRNSIIKDNSELGVVFRNLDLNNNIKISSEFTNKGFRELIISPKKIRSGVVTHKQMSSKDTVISDSASNIVAVLDEGLKYSFYHKEFQKQKSIQNVEVKIDGAAVTVTQPKKYKEKYYGVYIGSNLMNHLPYIPGRLEKIIKDKQDDLLIDMLKKFDPRIDKINTMSTGEIFIDIGLKSMVPINILGGGIIKALALLTSIFAVKGGILLIDEIENGLHYTSINVIWETLIELCKKLNTQMFITSHNYDVVTQLVKVLESDKDFRDKAVSYTIKNLPNGNVEALKYNFEDFSNASKKGIEIRGLSK